jgi:hypothetical protein
MQGLRHELKYLINTGEYLYLSRLLDVLLQRDPHGDAYNEYHIRSLYFDTWTNSALAEKVAGVGERRKYRLRIYNHSDALVRLECKHKVGEYIQKRSLTVPRDLAEQLIAGDTTGLTATAEPLLHEMFREMTLRRLHPVVLVDYFREAYIHPAEDVRLTFDKQLRTGLGSIDLFGGPKIPTVDPMPQPWTILEVKYNRGLPDHIRAVLNGVTGQRSAASKYVLCRTFEDLDY